MAADITAPHHLDPGPSFIPLYLKSRLGAEIQGGPHGSDKEKICQI